MQIDNPVQQVANSTFFVAQHTDRTAGAGRLKDWRTARDLGQLMASQWPTSTIWVDMPRQVSGVRDADCKARWPKRLCRRVHCDLARSEKHSRRLWCLNEGVGVAGSRKTTPPIHALSVSGGGAVNHKVADELDDTTRTRRVRSWPNCFPSFGQLGNILQRS